MTMSESIGKSTRIPLDSFFLNQQYFFGDSIVCLFVLLEDYCSGFCLSLFLPPLSPFMMKKGIMKFELLAILYYLKGTFSVPFSENWPSLVMKI